MTQQQWQTFTTFREQFKAMCAQWSSRLPNLQALQQQAAASANTPLYQFENPIVYNTDLDKITQADDIRLIVIGDNPGKDEQLTKNQRYLCGQAGKIAEGYFRRTPELGIDFRRNAIILNKTPIHSAKTNQLKWMIKQGGTDFATLLEETQIWMAQQTANLQQSLGTELWLVGYAELKQKGIFTSYRDALKNAYDCNGQACTTAQASSDSEKTSATAQASTAQRAHAAWNQVYVFQHFSMNRFSIDLAEFIKNSGSSTKPLAESIHQLGKMHCTEIFGD